MSIPTIRTIAIALMAALPASPVQAGVPAAPAAAHTKCLGTSGASSLIPAPADPYPLMAAGWGPELGSGLMASRWAEDWSGMAKAGTAPPLKTMPLGETALLSISSSMRLRHVSWSNAQLQRANDFDQAQLRAIIGADLRLSPNLRFFGEVGAGRVEGRRELATANFENAASLQQLFMDVRGDIDGTLVGAMVGRQEFSDGPRQLISLSDGPNLHRTWNGIRLYGHGARQRFGAFDFRATRLGRGTFDEEVELAEKLRGLNASFIVSSGNGPNTYLDPFWIQSTNPAYQVAGRPGVDERDTFGARLWGQRGNARFDWTVARQTGRTVDERRIDAWGLFAVQSLVLTESGWKPRLTSRLDVASGGGAYGTGAVRNFNPLYASSNYLGESQLLGLGNLLMATPGIAVSPTSRTTLSFEAGHARRLDVNDAVYAGGGRTYVGTERVAGRHIGNLSRFTGTWSLDRNFAFRLNIEHLHAGTALRAAGFPSGTYAYLDVTYHY